MSKWTKTAGLLFAAASAVFANQAALGQAAPAPAQTPANDPFANGKEALAYCAAHGRDNGDKCIGRFLSHDAADIIYMCFPSADVRQSRCYRD